MLVNIFSKIAWDFCDDSKGEGPTKFCCENLIQMMQLSPFLVDLVLVFCWNVESYWRERGGAASHHYLRPPFSTEGGGGGTTLNGQNDPFGKIYRSRVGFGFATLWKPCKPCENWMQMMQLSPFLNPSMSCGCNPILFEIFTKRGLHLSVLELHPPTFLVPIVEKVVIRGCNPSLLIMCTSASLFFIKIQFPPKMFVLGKWVIE